MVITIDHQVSTTGTTFPSNQSFSGTMSVPDGTIVDYFSVELIMDSSLPQPPQNTKLEYIDTSRPSNNTHVEQMTFFGNGLITVGETLLADGNTHYKGNSNVVISSDGMYDIFSTFVNGPGLQAPWISINSTSFSSAINSPYIGLEFLVSAYGEVSAVPIPSAVVLFGSGLVALYAMSKRKVTKYESA
jgi:hypothetical protein